MHDTAAHYFDLLVVLVEKDFKIRYRNSVLGFAWALLNPLAYMIILTLVFSLLLRLNIPNFAAWSLIGLLIWRFFSVGTAQGSSSLSADPSLVTKVYLPRFVLVLSKAVANLLGAALEFVTLIPLLIFLGVSLTVFWLLLPLILFLEFVLVFGVSLALSSLNVRYRDFYQLWEIALQLGFFLSPIVYSTDFIPGRYQFAYSLNPITRLIESTRDIFLYGRSPSVFDIAVIFLAVLVLLALGSVIFKSWEQRLVEEL